MKKIILFCLIVVAVLPVNAQYLLDDGNYKYNEKNYGESFDKGYGENSSFNFGENTSFEVGYRGFADFGLGFSTTASNDDDGYSTIMFSTTHGYQILKDYLFVGAGIGYWYMYSYGASVLPLFADVRSDFYNFGRFSVFADLQIGYSISDQTGFYFGPQIGLRYAISDKFGLNLGLGCQLFRDEEFSYEDGSGIGYFSIKLGVDF